MIGHVERKTEEDVTENMEVYGHRNIGRPKLRWSDITRKDMEKGVQRERNHKTRGCGD